MSKTITIDLIGPSPASVKPVREGVYVKLHHAWVGCDPVRYTRFFKGAWRRWQFRCERASTETEYSAFHDEEWYALPYNLPPGTWLDHIQGLTFRVIPPSA